MRIHPSLTEVSLYDRIQAERRSTMHWLHILLVILTCGMWFPAYLVRTACNAQHNRRIDDKLAGALAAMSMVTK